MLVGLRREDRRRYADIGFRTSDLGGLNYGFEIPPTSTADGGELMGEGDRVATKHEGGEAAERRNEVNCDVRTATASDPHSERPKDDQAPDLEPRDNQVSDLELKDDLASDLADPEVTSSTTAENRPLEAPPEVVQEKEIGIRNQTCETAEMENRSEVAEQIGNPNDETGQPVSLPTDTGQAGMEEQADDDDDNVEGDPFEQLPPRAPYQDPPVFRGHNNYGFEFFPSWADIDDPNRQSVNESESERSSYEDD